MLDFNLEKKVEVGRESEFPNLYNLYIFERDEAGEIVGSPQIPWHWSLHFHAQEVQAIHTVTTDIREAPKSARYIGVKLKSGYEAEDPIRSTRFSMFGTERTISDISLTIYPLDADDEKPLCQAFGIPSYNFEHDFRKERAEDVLSFTAKIGRSDFDSCLQLAERGEISSLWLRVSFVRGFYSEWSPSIQTSSIKVLTDSDVHRIELTDGELMHHLGEVGEFSLGWLRTDQSRRSSDQTDARELPSSDLVDEFAPSELQQISSLLLKTALRVERAVGWIFLALLVIGVLACISVLKSCVT